ncbi:hypothetical protein ACFPTO_12085 [Paraburkholderia denitrificans]|uniref:Uncharacterized protein n=1 Tax=Paraburkholderia denitrificans TaxID=694025 RepID=A0ABW0J8X4_9BURK
MKKLNMIWFVEARCGSDRGVVADVVEMEATHGKHGILSGAPGRVVAVTGRRARGAVVTFAHQGGRRARRVAQTL